MSTRAQRYYPDEPAPAYCAEEPPPAYEAEYSEPADLTWLGQNLTIRKSSFMSTAKLRQPFPLLSLVPMPPALPAPEPEKPCNHAQSARSAFAVRECAATAPEAISAARRDCSRAELRRLRPDFLRLERAARAARLEIDRLERRVASVPQLFDDDVSLF